VRGSKGHKAVKDTVETTLAFFTIGIFYIKNVNIL
jgi:hypothetical protein